MRIVKDLGTVEPVCGRFSGQLHAGLAVTLSNGRRVWLLTEEKDEDVALDIEILLIEMLAETEKMSSVPELKASDLAPEAVLKILDPKTGIEYLRVLRTVSQEIDPLFNAIVDGVVVRDRITDDRARALYDRLVAAKRGKKP